MTVPALSVDRTGTSYQRSAAWTDGLRRNDPVAIKALYTAHFHSVRQFVLRNNGSLDDAQDVFQEALTVLWLKVKEDRLHTEAMADPGGFLYRVARNKWLDTLRSASHKHMKVVSDDEHMRIADGVDEGTEERLARLRTVYANMDEKCRNILDRFYYERQDLATIAAAMGVEEESIRTIKYRCMMKLRSFRRTIAGDGHEPLRP